MASNSDRPSIKLPLRLDAAALVAALTMIVGGALSYAELSSGLAEAQADIAELRTEVKATAGERRALLDVLTEIRERLARIESQIATERRERRGRDSHAD